MDTENQQVSNVSVPTEAASTSPETTNESTVTETSQSNDNSGRPAGFEPVEFTPEQKQRVDRIYGNMKRYENETKSLKEDNRRLLAALENIQQEQSKIVNHIQLNDFQEAENSLKNMAKKAFEAGDIDSYTETMAKLNAINTKKYLAENQQREQPKVQQHPQAQELPQHITATDAVDLAVQRGEMAAEDARVFKAWIGEKDQSGNVLRPWANVNDVRNTTAAIEARAVFSNPAFDNLTYAQKLAEVDRRMGLNRQQQQVGQNVMGGNLTRGAKNNNIKLSDQQKKIALMTKFAGPNKSDADHLEAYRQAVIKSQAKGATA